MAGWGHSKHAPAPPDDEEEQDEGADEEQEPDEGDQAPDEEDDELANFCRVCLTALFPPEGEEPSDQVLDIVEISPSVRFHSGCIVCGICGCRLPDSRKRHQSSVWFYCEACMPICSLETQLSDARKMWRLEPTRAENNAAGAPLEEYPNLHAFLAKHIDASLVEETKQALEKEGIVGDQFWRSALMALAGAPNWWSLPVKKAVLAVISNVLNPPKPLAVDEPGVTVPVPEDDSVQNLELRLRGSAGGVGGFGQSLYQLYQKFAAGRGPEDAERKDATVRLMRGATILAQRILKHAKKKGADPQGQSVLAFELQTAQLFFLLDKMTARQRNIGPSTALPGTRDIYGALPRDVCKLIFTWLSYQEVLQCRLVSKAWLALADEELIWMMLHKSMLGRYKLPSLTWRQSFINIWTELFPLLPQNRIVRKASIFFDPISLRVQAHWSSIGVPRPFVPVLPPPPAAFPKLAHPLSSPGVTMGLSISFGASLDYLDLELGSRACDTATVFKNPTVVECMLQRYVNFMQLRTTYPDAPLVPTDDIAMVWASHLIRPLQYQQDCKKLFGYVVPHDGVTDRTLDLQFWDALKLTEDLWRKEFGTDYSLRPPGTRNRSSLCTLLMVAGYTHEKEDDQAYRREVAASGAAMPPAEPGYYENFATGGKASDDPKVEEIVDHCKAVLAKTAPWQNPLSITIQDLLEDRNWSAYLERFCRLIRTSRSNDNLASGHGGLKLYEKFLYLQLKHPEIELEPNYMIEIGWRTHMMDPLGYAADCQRLFGRLLSRSPWSPPSRLVAYGQTQELWRQEYGSELEFEPVMSQENKPATQTQEELDSLVTFRDALDPEYVTSAHRPPPRKLPSVQAAIDNNFCTFSATGLDFSQQDYYHCYTCTDNCDLDPDEAICVTCARVCHLGHELSELVSAHPFFCDCGASLDCNAMPPANWQPPVLPPPSKGDEKEREQSE